jgi:tetratricopeptide (TPR) repeat protein
MSIAKLSAALRPISLGVMLFFVVAAECAIGQTPQTPSPAATDFDNLQKQALDEGESGKVSDAIRDYRRAIELQPEWKEGLWNLGMLLYSSNRYAEAKTVFLRVTALAPNLGLAWGLLGLSEYENGEYDAVLPHLEKAQELGIAEDDEIARISTFHLGLILIRAGEFERASQLLQANFGSGVIPPQAKIALGLAALRVPLLPVQLDPSWDAVVLETGEAVTAGSDAPRRFAEILQTYPALPYLRLASAQALEQAGKFNEALVQLRAETRISPASPTVWIALSRLELHQGETNQALQSAQEALRLAPQMREAHQALAQVLQAAGKQEQAVAARQFTPPAGMILPATEQRIVLLYGNAGVKVGAAAEANQAQWERALREYAAADYAAASTDLKAWLAAAPENGTGWALLGLCEFAREEFDNALIHLERSAKLGLRASPEFIHRARYTYGILLVHAGRFDEATEVLASTGDATSPFAAKVKVALGLALLRKPQLPAADNAPQSEVVSSAGQIAVLLQQSKYDEAFAQFKRLLERYPTEPFLHYAYGTALIAISEFDRAAVEMQAETAVSPRSELPCVRLASIALRRHDGQTALTWAQRALTLAPESVEAHYLLGRAALETGDLDAALRELEIACKLSPASPEIHFNLAKAYARAKMPEKAQRERENFSRLSEAQKVNVPSATPQ